MFIYIPELGINIFLIYNWNSMKVGYYKAVCTLECLLKIITLKCLFVGESSVSY